MGVALTADDSGDGTANVVINHGMAERQFPGQDRLGRRLRFVPRDDEDAAAQPWRTVVGVVRTFQQGNADEAFHSPVVYLPFPRAPDRMSSLLARSTLPPTAVMAAVRAAARPRASLR